MATKRKKAHGAEAQHLWRRPRRAGLLRPVRRPLRRRDADAADPRAGACLRGCEGRSRLPARARRPQRPLRRPAEPALFRRAPDRALRESAASGRAAPRSTSSATSSITPAATRSTTAWARSCSPSAWARRASSPRPAPASTAWRWRRCAPSSAALRDLHGRGRRRAPEAQCVPHEAAGRQGQRRHVRRADAQGRHERGAARLGRQRARHLLHHRHGRRPAPLSGHGARLPVA